MGECAVCGSSSRQISQVLGLCAPCILRDTAAARARAVQAHRASRAKFGLPPHPPRAAEGLPCGRCANACVIEPGEVGYCGVRASDGRTVTGGDEACAAVQWYDDPLPTNCVADWVCPASGAAGYPRFTDTQGPEHGCVNLAVFYEACSFDCLFCQNWHFRSHSIRGPRHSAQELAAAVGDTTRCICFFGGDPTCQVGHALAAARMARRRRGGHPLRICWETNGSMSRPALEEIAELAIASGGCIKFDLKAWDDALHRALCGVSNRRTLENFQHVGGLISRRPDPPLLVASTLLVPGYVDASQVRSIARFIAGIARDIPYALLAFHGEFEMSDVPTTSRREAYECLEAAKAAGLTRVRLGNVHLLR